MKEITEIRAEITEIKKMEIPQIKIKTKNYIFGKIIKLKSLWKDNLKKTEKTNFHYQ